MCEELVDEEILEHICKELVMEECLENAYGTGCGKMRI